MKYDTYQVSHLWHVINGEFRCAWAFPCSVWKLYNPYCCVCLLVHAENKGLPLIELFHQILKWSYVQTSQCSWVTIIAIFIFSRGFTVPLMTSCIVMVKNVAQILFMGGCTHTHLLLMVTLYRCEIPWVHWKLNIIIIHTTCYWEFHVYSEFNWIPHLLYSIKTNYQSCTPAHSNTHTHTHPSIAHTTSFSGSQSAIIFIEVISPFLLCAHDMCKTRVTRKSSG